MFFPPFISKPDSVAQIMLKVLLALLPGIAMYVWYFGPAILVSITLASITALSTEALMLKLRNRPIAPFLKDNSACAHIARLNSINNTFTFHQRRIPVFLIRQGLQIAVNNTTFTLAGIGAKLKRGKGVSAAFKADLTGRNRKRQRTQIRALAAGF